MFYRSCPMFGYRAARDKRAERYQVSRHVND